MVKVFTTNKNNKIELTEKELKELLDEAYWEGYSNNKHTYTYISPNWSPYYWTCSNANTTSTTYTLSSSNSTDGLTINCKNTSGTEL